MCVKIDKKQMTIEEFLTNPTASILIDVRGGVESDPSIPGSKNVYVLDIEERPEAFEKRFASQLAIQPMLLYCSKGEGSRYLVDRFSGKYQIKSLQGGMVAYLTTISQLLHEHPYEDSTYRGDTMVKILEALTDRRTDPEVFQKIISHLLKHTPIQKFARLQPHLTPSASLQKIIHNATPDKAVFIIFSDHDCGLCTILRQHLPWFAETYRNQIDVIGADVQKHPELAREYAIHTIPTVIVYKNGKKVLKEVAVSSKEQLIKMVESVSV